MNINKLKKLEIIRRLYQTHPVADLIFNFPRISYLLGKYFLAPLVFKNETKYNSRVRYPFMIAGGGTISPDYIHASKYLRKDFTKYFKTIVDSETNDRTMVWSVWNLPLEIIKSFDVDVFIPETLSTIANFPGTDFGVKFLEESEMEGLPVEYCSSQKFAIGGYLLKQAPDPDLIISCTQPCDSVVSAYQTLQRWTKVPMFMVDSSYWDDESSYKNYEDNLWELIKFLEKHLKQKMDWDKLKHICENLNKANYYYNELSEMARAIPSPVAILLLNFGWTAKLIAMGTDNGVTGARLLYESAKAKLKKGKGYLKNEKIRIIWWDLPIAFAGIEAWLAKKFNALTVVNYISRVEHTIIDITSQENMIRDIAKNHLHTAMNRQCRGAVELNIEEFEQVIDEYSGDCFIFSRHQACKHNWAYIKILKDICRKTGLPALFLDVDIFDKRTCTEEQIQKEISEFFMSNGLA